MTKSSRKQLTYKRHKIDVHLKFLWLKIAAIEKEIEKTSYPTACFLVSFIFLGSIFGFFKNVLVLWNTHVREKLHRSRL